MFCDKSEATLEEANDLAECRLLASPCHRSLGGPSWLQSTHMVPGLAGPKLDGQMLPPPKPPSYLHRSSRKVASVRCVGTLRGPNACLHSQRRSAWWHNPCLLPIFQSSCSVEALAQCSVNEKVCREQRQAGCHHTAWATPYVCWELGELFSAQGKVGPELFYLASNSKKLISPNRKATQVLEACLPWALEPGADFKSIHEALLDKRSRRCLKPTKWTLSNQSILPTAVCCHSGNAERSIVYADSQVWAAHS